MSQGRASLSVVSTAAVSERRIQRSASARSSDETSTLPALMSAMVEPMASWPMLPWTWVSLIRSRVLSRASLMARPPSSARRLKRGSTARLASMRPTEAMVSESSGRVTITSSKLSVKGKRRLTALMLMLSPVASEAMTVALSTSHFCAGGTYTRNGSASNKATMAAMVMTICLAQSFIYYWN